MRASLAVEVKEAFERVFRRPARTMTPKQRAGELKKIENKIRPLISACDGLSFEGIDDLNEEMPNAYSDISGQFEPAIVRLREFIPALREEIEMLRSAHGMEFHHRGGRSTDPRIRAVAVQLADLYARYQHKIPAHRTSPDTGRMISGFNRFAADAFEHFLPKSAGPPRALRTALQDVAARLDWSSEAGTREAKTRQPLL